MNVPAVRAILRGLGVASWVFLGTNPNDITAHQASKSIRQQVHEPGGFERIVVTTYDPVPLSQLVGRADLIVEASTPGGRSSLNHTETDIFTDYTFSVHSVIKNRRRPDFHAGQTITIRRNSGTVIIDGRAAMMHENGFPSFNTNEHYILFLIERPHDQGYTVFGGPQGAFRAGERVTTLATRLDDGVDPTPSMSRAEFLGEVRALLQYSDN
jgi:hypothetical protein